MNDQPGNGAPSSAAVDPSSAAVDPTSSIQPPTSSTQPPRRHRILIGVLFGLATIIGIVAVLSVWANRQALNTDNWTNTSTQLLADKRIQTAVAAYSVDQLFSSGVVEAQLKSVLPKPFEALAGPINGGLQQLAGQIAPRLLASPQVQQAWRQANRAAHATLIKIINGGSSLASTRGGVVTLNLRELVDQLAARLGVQSQVAAARAKLQANIGTVKAAASGAGVTLPPSSGQLVIMRASQLKTAQDVASWIKGLALILPILTFALFALAVWLSRGRRRAALRTVGWCFVAVGLVVLLARRVIGNAIVDSLVKNPSNKPAAHDVWSLGTTLLRDIGVAVVIYGLIFVTAAWLGGRTRPAVALRRLLAPGLREHPTAAYGIAFGVLLLVVVWGPSPATRQVPYIVLFAALFALGIHSLRRQTATEFPEGQRVSTPIMAGAPRKDDGGGRIAELERLSRLRDSGALTDAEFASEKAVVIGST